MLKAVIFDFDGVIANTETRNLMYFEMALKTFEIELNDKERRYIIGRNDRGTIEDYLGKSPFKPSYEDYLKARRQLSNSYEDGTLKAETGIEDFIKKLRSDGIKTAVASSTSSHLILSALNTLKMLNLFDAVVCGDMVKKLKPEPEIYLKTLSYIGVSPDEAFVIEDSAVGIKAAVNAGIRAIGYTGATAGEDTSECIFTLNSYRGAFEKILNALPV